MGTRRGYHAGIFLFCLFFLFCCTFISCNPPIVHFPGEQEVHGEGYLGDGDLLKLLGSAVESAVKSLYAVNLTAHTEAHLCPIPGDNVFKHYTDGLSPQQKADALQELNSETAKTELVHSLRRLRFRVDAPKLPFRQEERARIERPIPSGGPVDVWINTKAVQGHKLPQFVQMVVHEAKHVVYPHLTDLSPYLSFGQFQRYADYTGACLALRLSASIPVERLFRILVNGQPNLMWIAYAKEPLGEETTPIRGFLGPGRDYTLRHLSGKLGVSSLLFSVPDEIGSEGENASVEGTITREQGRVLINGTYSHANGKKSNFEGKEIKSYFHDFSGSSGFPMGKV